jgi:crotonobetainyl-CoA:carnitine CoA-transferase CaiB-like acyl-CoA transferase
VAPPIRVDGTRLAHRTPAPRLGEQTEEVLHEIGYTQQEIAELTSAGVVHQAAP